MAVASAPSTRILLVRHAQAGGAGHPYGPEAPLTERGREQAERIATALADLAIHAVIASPFRRASDTASPAVDALDLPLELDARFGEFRMDDPAVPPPTAEEIAREREYLMLWQPEHQATAGGETLAAFHTRIAAALEDLTVRFPGEAVAVFTHAGAIAACMRWAYGLTAAQPWHSDVEIFNASITEIEHWPAGRHPQGAPFASAIHRLNDVRHLPRYLITEI